MMILNRFFSDFSAMRKGLFLSTLALSAGFFSAIASAGPGVAASASQQISASASRAAEAEIRDTAGRQGWEEIHIEVEPVMPPEASALLACTKGLRTQPTGGNRRLLSRLRYDISCPAAPGWTITVIMKATVNVPVVTSAQGLERGRIIGEGDIALSEQNVAQIADRFFTQPQEVIGQTVKRRLNAGQPITAAALDQPVLVARGQQVMLIIQHQGIEASTMGEALKQGRKGEMIRVRNLSSQRVVDGLVESAGVVRVAGAALAQ